MKIIALGDSLTEGFLVSKNYTDYLAEFGHEITNLGINGDTTHGMLERFNPEPADVLVVLGGTNDLYQGMSRELAVENIKKILEKSLATHNIVVLPPYIEEEEAYPIYGMINDNIAAYAEELEKLNDNIIDSRIINPSYIDGLHMREDFHEKLAKMINKEIESF